MATVFWHRVTPTRCGEVGMAIVGMVMLGSVALWMIVEELD
jgi:hypothetical protein